MEVGYVGRKNVLDLNTQGGYVLLLKLSSQVTLDEGGLKRVSFFPFFSFFFVRVVSLGADG